jgi:IS30 family transposase
MDPRSPVTSRGGPRCDRRRDRIAAEQLRRSLTWDQGAEMAQHAQHQIDTGLQLYFCDLQSPWPCGTSENTNGLLRQYFARGTHWPGTAQIPRRRRRRPERASEKDAR